MEMRVHPDKLDNTELVNGFPVSYAEAVESFENATGKEWSDVDQEIQEDFLNEMQEQINQYISNCDLNILTENALDWLATLTNINEKQKERGQE